jgi:8-oxo-dGTP diphosphatase
MPAARTGSDRRQVSAGGVVFRRTARGIEVVLIKAGGRWSFPKGNMERGEAPPVTALREIAEETGLPHDRLRVVAQLPQVDYAFRWGRALIFKRVHYFLVELTARAAALCPQLSEIEEVRWFSPAAARQAIGFKNARQTLDEALGQLEALRLAS